MRVYHFLSAKDAVNDLRNRRIKISRFEDLNDPFELLSIELADKSIRKAFIDTKKKIAEENGIICFSKNWSNPVLWSHYAEKHRGVCLGFDVPDHSLAHIEYNAKRLVKEVIDDDGKLAIDEPFMIKLLTIKYKDWEYEDEIRIFVGLKEKEKVSGLYFKDFDNDLVLREVILGARHKEDIQQLQSILQNYTNVRLIQGRMAFRSFRIVENKERTKDINRIIK
jgi:hypothetical protein